MANATLALSNPGTQTGHFVVTATFASAVEGFDGMNVSIVAVTGNGITGVLFRVTGSGLGYNITFQLPEDVEGSFSISLVGMVTEEGGSTPEAIMANSLTASYDNHSFINAGFGEVTHTRDGEIIVPIRFEEEVSYFHKTDCEVTTISGDDPHDFEYFLTKVDDENFELTFFPTPDKRGVFAINITGYVYSIRDVRHDNVVVTPILVPFNSMIPQIIDHSSPDELSSGNWDYYIELNSPAIGIGIDAFVYEGENPGTPSLYLASDLDVKPGLPPEPLNLDNPPDCFSGWFLDSTGNSVLPAKYLLLRFNVPDGRSGPLEIGLRETHRIRGSI